MTTGIHKQRGMGFFGFIFVAVSLIFVAIAGMKLVPPYVHNAQIVSIFRTIATDPAMQTGTSKEVKESYTKRANINYITDLTSEDIDISKDNGVLSLSARYTVKIPVAGNISLMLDFNPSSS